MLKVMGILLILVGVVGMGACEKRRMERQIEWLKRLSNLLDLLKEEITFSNKTLPEACYRAAMKCPEEEKRMLEKVYIDCTKGNCESFANAWKQECEQLLIGKALEKTQEQEIIRFFDDSGWDLRVWESTFERQCERFRKNAEECQSVKAQKLKMFISLTSLAGFAVIILLW